ncbi:MAG: glycosyltransferase family 39 protein, partial [Ruthenibacterium sp.]
VLFLFLLSRRLFGTCVAWLSFLLCAPAAALSPWIAVPYSDTYSMPFAMGSIYFYVLAREQRHPLRSGLYAALCGAWLALGARMKPTIVLLIAAVVLVELLCTAGRRRAFSAAAPSTENGQEHTAAFLDNAPFDSFRNCDRSPRRAILCASHKPMHKCNVKAHCDTGAQQAKSAAVQGHPLLRVAACFLLGLLLAYGAGGMFQNHATNGFLNDKRVEQESFSATHYLMMGLSQPHGSYAYEDMKFTESVKGREAKAEANLAETARRLHKLGPTGYAAFLWRKLNFTWDDGTFFFGREGMFYWGEPPQNSAFARAVQSVFRADGAHYGALALWQQAQWLLLLLLMLCGTLYRKGPYAKWIWCARIGTLGLLCFLLLFEARSRYIYHFLPVLYLAALGGLLVLLQACMRARSPAAHDAAAMQNSRKGDDLCQSLPRR